MENGYDIEHFIPILLAQQLQNTSHHYITYNTLVLRVLKRISRACNVPWAYVLQQGPHELDTQSHLDLLTLWKQQEKPVTMDEQHCIERVLGHDHVRPTDLTKLAGILAKINSQSSMRDVWKWFAVDGFLGDDPKMYVDNFKYDPDEFRGKHVRAVRQVWEDRPEILNPTMMKDFLDNVLEQQNYEDCGYLTEVGQYLKEIGDWKKDQMEKLGKRKRSDDESKSKKKNRVAKKEEEEGGEPKREEAEERMSKPKRKREEEEEMMSKPKRKRYAPKKTIVEKEEKSSRLEEEEVIIEHGED